VTPAAASNHVSCKCGQVTWQEFNIVTTKLNHVSGHFLVFGTPVIPVFIILSVFVQVTEDTALSKLSIFLYQERFKGIFGGPTYFDV
jgi:hypothetical protein